MKKSELKEVIKKHLDEIRFIPNNNYSIDDLIKNLIKIMGYKKYQLGVESDMGVYWVTLPTNAISTKDLDILKDILPQNSYIGYYPHISKGLSIKTSIPI